MVTDESTQNNFLFRAKDTDDDEFLLLTVRTCCFVKCCIPVNILNDIIADIFWLVTNDIHKPASF